FRKGSGTPKSRQGGEAMLVIALCKGRLLDPALDLLSRSGIRFSEDLASSRKLIFGSENGQCRVVLVKPADVPTYVEYGAADVGITGRDVIMESSADLLQPMDLKFGYCKIVVAGFGAGSDEPDRALKNAATSIRVATKYPRITMDYYNA